VNRWYVAGALLATAVIGTAAAPSTAAQSVTDAHVKALLAEVGAQPQAPPSSAQPVLPGTAQSPQALAPIPLSLDEAVALALERNLDIAVERLNPRTFDLSLEALRANYRPTVTSAVSQGYLVDLPRNQLSGGNRVANDTTTVNAGASQLLPWGGSSAAVAWNNRRLDSTNAFNTFNPQYNSTFTLSFAQPILRNFITDNTRTQIKVTQLNRDISELDVRAVVTNTLADVRNAYWDLVFASEAVDVARRSLTLAHKLLEDNRVRVEVGTLAPIDIVQAEAEVATRRQALATIEAVARTAELSLKQLIVSGTDDPHWRAPLNPIDRPTNRVETIDVEAALRVALQKRTDLEQSRRTLQINDANLKLLRNQTLPAADLVASYGLQGIGGTQLIRDNDLGGRVTGQIPGGFADALDLIGRRDYPTWSVALLVSYPIGTSAAQANYARAKIAVQQTQAQMKQLELRIATEVTNTALQVGSNEKRVEAATAARELAQRRLEAETSKFEVGLSTNFFVVQAQRDLADAQNAELRALLDYRKSIVDFERVQETSLSSAGITVVTTGGTLNAPRAGGGGGGGGGGNTP
jgi:outer membrane protein